MKKNLLLLFLCVSVFVNAQWTEFPLNEEKTDVYFSEVVNKDGFNQALLLSTLKEWVAKTFVSYKDVLKLEDKESGVIIINPLFDVYSYAIGKTKVGVVKYDMKIQVKDNRFKYEIYNILHVEQKLKTPGILIKPKPTEKEDLILFYSWESIQKQALVNFNKITADLKIFIANSKANEDW